MRREEAVGDFTVHVGCSLQDRSFVCEDRQRKEEKRRKAEEERLRREEELSIFHL